ncbi:AAA family ATPase [Halomonas cerina]|uniref:Nuclease SbcCD subunit C n=1 Tax=Halomonas cerina TaxID=447424 RepID=A0A839VB96_9GAMM|nr:AAA family ATPase [Halomonas cerina]MBB3189987.1 exonuclease SbcC [Halomonas cerina]
MKILALRLANLASLSGPLTLDFTATPLADAGLFAITGPTGAGKSTLLDALCLALYGGTPRLRQAPGREAPLPDVEGETLNTADPRTLLRRGTASGYAEVDFLGRDGRRYRARWAVRRAREKVGGKLQKVEQSLRDLEDDRLLTTQKREFDRLLPERLGLSFEQFTRAVLLAQSEFAAFLQADDNERSDLLERLTGTAEYSAISIAAYRRASEAKKTVDALTTRLADDLPAEPQARAELKRHAKTAQGELDAVQAQVKHLETQQQWHASDDRLREAWLEGYRQQQDAEAHWQGLAGARADREWRRLLAPQRHRLTRQAELPGEIAATEATHAETQRALEKARATQQQARQDNDRTEQALIEAIDARRQAEPALREARDQAQALATLEKQLTDLKANRNQQQKQADMLAEQRHRASDEQRARQKQHDEWQSALHRLLGAHPHLDAARQAAQQAHDHAAQRHLALGDLASRWQEFSRADAAKRRLTGQVDKDRQRKARRLAEGQNARQRLAEAQHHYASVSALIERSRAVRSESVARLRENLQEGDPCPVCGGLDHPWRHQPPATPEAAQLAAQQDEEDRQLSNAQRQRDEAQQARDELFGEYRALEAALKQHQQDLAEAERRLGAARAALEEHSLYAELTAVSEAERDAWLPAQRRDSEAARRHHRQSLDELTRSEAELAPLEESLRQGELALARLETRHDDLIRELGDLAERIPPLQAQRTQLTDRLAVLLGEHASPDTWQQHLDTEHESARQAREAALTRQHDAAQAQQRLTQQNGHEAERLTQLRQEQETLDRELADWRRAHPELDDTTLARLLTQSEANAQQEEQRLDKADQARLSATATLAERRDALLRHRRGQALTEDDTDETLLGDAMAVELHRRQQAVSQAQADLTPRLKEAQQARDTAAFALSDDDRRRERQQAAQQDLEAARAEYRRWGRISELIGSADGKAFRRIAQGYNLEQLLEHANVHLAGLSRRYRLIRGGSELGLLVVDHDMGDERRSVHSLSGGETFLVSLALALGLASMASGELVIESLFIDEGFGSLDPQSLALAMEALDGLQALGRRVGVISHVQEMHERIPVQIQVEPLGNGTSRARLVSA